MNHHQGWNPSNDSLRDLWIGIALTFAIYILFVFLVAMFLGLVAYFLAIIVHISAIVVSFLKGRKRLGQGLLIGLGFVILLVAACFGILLYTLG